ncbi:hypothetical protein LJR016_000061 [Devosia sp. LjRoot16]|uniref:hypothetical protein n=1 Tax=Devosia sp. LjRoot16 TaxID=3342271 RepID=UPI003ED08E78
MLHIANARLPALILGITLALSFGASAIAESRVVFQASKDDVKKACDNIEGGGGVPVKGEGGTGYGCYNTNNGVLVACSDGGTCTGYLPKGAPRKKALGNVLNFGAGVGAAPETKSSEGAGGDGGGGAGGEVPCGGPDGCIQ